ncbi:MAG: 4a-hydroxytetrahydrobiopterin dehydratase [Propionibacteriales bacterium]|nr:4a-hydroxytetrahydrobiopterin dehydratase [Propionibacteriales bacterium]
MADIFTNAQISAALETDLDGWTLDGDSIVRAVETDSFTAGIHLVDEVAKVAEELNHHPDIDIRWTTLTFRLSTHSEGGVTDDDLKLAAEIDRLSSS